MGGPEVYVIMLAHIAAADGQCVQTLTGHGSFVNSAVFSPDGTHVLTASSDNSAKIWSAASGHCLQTLTGHGGNVTHAAFSPL